jgi:putative spermidine/putrescine transport system ATP-binding protein
MRDFKKIVIKELTKDFGSKAALSGFSLEVSRGEFVTFLGPSGCGKSTALNCIAGLLPISRGGIFVDEECIDDGTNKVPPEKREFGMVFQNYALFPHLTVFQNVAFGLHLRRLPRAEVREKVIAALTLVHLEGYLDKYPTQMSGGEQQRVAIARCIVLEPRLLMLDEPLSNLDAKLRLEMRYEILALHTRLGVTTIYVTHDQQEALALSDRIVVMRSGVIQQVGTPVEVYSNPANLFVADFMGFKNLWPATIESLTETATGVDAVVRVGGTRLEARCPYGPADPRRAALASAFRSGATVRTAIRPEEVRLGRGASGATLKARVAMVEYQGQISHVTARIESGETAELRPSASVRMNDEVDVALDPQKIFLFADHGG